MTPALWKFVWCQRCGRGQRVQETGHLDPCASCRFDTFHVLHPFVRSLAWSAKMTQWDVAFLRLLNISWD